VFSETTCWRVGDLNWGYFIITGALNVTSGYRSPMFKTSMSLHCFQLVKNGLSGTVLPALETDYVDFEEVINEVNTIIKVGFYSSPAFAYLVISVVRVVVPWIRKVDATQEKLSEMFAIS
jgi:hypothetical protein